MSGQVSAHPFSLNAWRAAVRVNILAAAAACTMLCLCLFARCIVVARDPERRSPCPPTLFEQVGVLTLRVIEPSDMISQGPFNSTVTPSFWANITTGRVLGSSIGTSCIASEEGSQFTWGASSHLITAVQTLLNSTMLGVITVWQEGISMSGVFVRRFIPSASMMRLRLASWTLRMIGGITRFVRNGSLPSPGPTMTEFKECCHLVNASIDSSGIEQCSSLLACNTG
mmetsp:Transcript_9945/g.19715  ORF Transcript_9945/g.19715 Transcript_9945/m.19715 type:complete len:227 (+) Transcript_9945:66-746(+)